MTAVALEDSAIQAFTPVVGDAVRILTLGRALSPVQPATLSRRIDGGFLFAALVGGPRETPPFIATADPEGRLGNERPAGLPDDAAPLHAAVLAARPEAGAVVLIRAPRLAAWGLSGRALPVRYFQMFSYTRATEIPVAAPSAQAIAAVLAAHPDAPALLLEDGRSLIWGAQPQRAVRLVLSLEEAAHVTSIAARLGGAADYPAAAREQIYLSLQTQARH